MSTEYTHFDRLSFENLFARGPDGNEQVVVDENGVLHVTGITGFGTSAFQVGTATLSAGVIQAVATTNQLLLGATSAFQVTLSAPAPSGASRVASLPVLSADDTFVMRTQAQTLTNKTLTTPIIAQILNGTATLSLPTVTTTLVGLSTTDTLTNKTLSSAVFSGTQSGFVTSGIVGIAGTTSTAANLNVGATNAAVGATQVGARVAMVGTSAATSNIIGYQTSSGFGSAASTSTHAVVAPFFTASVSKGAGSTITNLINYFATTQTAGTNNASFADNSGFVGNYFIHQSGTSPNVFGGPISPTRTDVASNASITGMASTSSYVYLTGSTATTIHGITAGKDGQILIIVNRTGANMTIANESATETTAANRITTLSGGDFVTTGDGSVMLIYDTVNSRWNRIGAVG